MKNKEPFSLKNIINKKRVIAVLVVLVLVAVMIFSNPEVHRFMFGGESVKISLQSDMDCSAVAYGKEMLLVSKDGVRAVDKNGKDTWTVVHNVTTPMVQVKNDYYMVADVNGTSVNVYKRDKIISQIKTEREILTAKMNKNGYVAAATVQLGYKGAVTVYDRGGSEKFKWYSGSGYIGDIDISPDGKSIAAAQLMTDGEQLYSRIMIINIGSEDDAKNIAELEGIAMTVRYKDNGEILVITDNGGYCYRKNGKQTMKIDFSGRTPVGYNVENQGNMVFAFDNGLNNTVLESYSAKGKLRGRYQSNDGIRSFDVNGECILASTVNNVTRITPKGKIKSRTAIGHDVKEIRIFSGRNSFLSLGGGGADIVKMK